MDRLTFYTQTVPSQLNLTLKESVGGLVDDSSAEITIAWEVSTNLNT